MSIEILEAMDECVVAKKAAKMIQRSLSRAKESALANDYDEGNQEMRRSTAMYEVPKTFNHFCGPLHLMDGDFDIFDLGDLNEGQELYHGYVA